MDKSIGRSPKESIYKQYHAPEHQDNLKVAF